MARLVGWAQRQTTLRDFGTALEIWLWMSHRIHVQRFHSKSNPLSQLLGSHCWRFCMSGAAQFQAWQSPSFSLQPSRQIDAPQRRLSERLGPLGPANMRRGMAQSWGTNGPCHKNRHFYIFLLCLKKMSRTHSVRVAVALQQVTCLHNLNSPFSPFSGRHWNAASSLIFLGATPVVSVSVLRSKPSRLGSFRSSRVICCLPTLYRAWQEPSSGTEPCHGCQFRGTSAGHSANQSMVQQFTKDGNIRRPWWKP